MRVGLIVLKAAMCNFISQKLTEHKKQGWKLSYNNDLLVELLGTIFLEKVSLISFKDTWGYL